MLYEDTYMMLPLHIDAILSLPFCCSHSQSSQVFLVMFINYFLMCLGSPVSSVWPSHFICPRRLRQQVGPSILQPAEPSVSADPSHSSHPSTAPGPYQTSPPPSPQSMHFFSLTWLSSSSPDCVCVCSLGSKMNKINVWNLGWHQVLQQIFKITNSCGANDFSFGAHVYV